MNEPFMKGYYYHIFNQGVNKMNLFYIPDNYIYLLKKIKNSIKEYGVDLIAYCLMPNHYHFLAQQLTERPLSDWVKMLFNGYAQALNKQLKRSGTIFQGRAKHILVDKDEYLIHLARYIHYNAVEANIVKLPEDWIYSNYLEWIGKRSGKLVNMAFVRRYFPNFEDYREFVLDYHIEKKLAKKLERYYLD